MRKHCENYFKALGYDESSLILCEVCGRVGVDLHHIEPRSKFGTKNREDMDKASNIICLCRKCHNDARGVASRDIKIQLKEIVSKRQVRV